LLKYCALGYAWSMAKQEATSLKIAHRDIALTIIAFLLGALWFFGMRFILVDRPATHYHANFALYINGERDPFESHSFYEEVVACYSKDEKYNPRHRVHMHNQISHVVHVHEKGATWGHFFANLGYTLGNNLVATDRGVFTDDADGKQLTFYLNGETVPAVSNRIIESEDVLLIDYGTEDTAVLERYYDAIKQDAAEYNRRTDPGACSGNAAEGLGERFKRTLGIDQ
jgi:hypothetical protein